MNERTENVYENKGPTWKNTIAFVTPAKAGIRCVERGHLARRRRHPRESGGPLLGPLDSRVRGNDG
jgi:hypothetical protein